MLSWLRPSWWLKRRRVKRQLRLIKVADTILVLRRFDQQDSILDDRLVKIVASGALKKHSLVRKKLVQDWKNALRRVGTLSDNDRRYMDDYIDRMQRKHERFINRYF